MVRTIWIMFEMSVGIDAAINLSVFLQISQLHALTYIIRWVELARFQIWLAIDLS